MAELPFISLNIMFKYGFIWYECQCFKPHDKSSLSSIINKEITDYGFPTLTHYIAKSIGSPPSNDRVDYFINFHEYKS